MAALAKYGPTPLHRLSFEPVARASRFAAGFPDGQLALFGEPPDAGREAERAAASQVLD
jgi:hypothetical protein